MTLKQAAEIVQTGLLERQAFGDIQDFYMNIDYYAKQVDAVILPKKSANHIVVDIKLGKDVQQRHI